MLLLSVLLCAAPTAGEDPQADSTPDASAQEETASIDAMLGAPSWPERVIALIRLDGRRDAAASASISGRLKDESWQVRCFAIDAAARRGETIDGDLFEEEEHPQVIRLLLQHGVVSHTKRLATGARRLMRSDDPGDVMTGLEIATAGNDEALRDAALTRLKEVFTTLDDALLARIGPHLARIVDLRRASGEVDPAPRTTEAWYDWIRTKRGQIALAPPRSPPAPPESSFIASLSAEEFARLRDYLGVLGTKDLDTAIVMDATSSMLPLINEARAGIEALILFLNDLAARARVAVIAYRDHDNLPLWEGCPLSPDAGAIRRFLFGLEITGGADLPEAVLEGLGACRQLEWRRDAMRHIVLVGDAEPHARDADAVLTICRECRDAGARLDSIHIPMQLDEMFVRAPAEMRRDREEEIRIHNERTALAFEQIAEEAGGEYVEVLSAQAFVPTLMRLSFDPAWRRAFDEFYARYLTLCR